MTVEIFINDDDALTVKGDFRLQDEAGKVIKEGGRVRLCRCGESASKPFCDNSHIKSQFDSKIRV
jgi:CDGSH-type Zn-finger protein